MLTATIHRHIVDVELEVPGSGVTVLFGPSGAGKSTILRAIAGLDPLDAGDITYAGTQWNDGQHIRVPPRDRELGYLFQEPALFPHLGVRGNVAYGLSGLGRTERETRVSEALELAHASGVQDRRVVELSGGEAQRVALARALARKPRLLLLDEPFTALDSPTRLALRQELRQLLMRERIPAIIVTHDRSEALALGDQVAVLVDGRIRQVGSPAEVFDRPADSVVAGVLGMETATPGVVASVASGIVMVDVQGHHVRASVTAQDLQPGDDVLVCIRAEDVSLGVGESPFHTSQRNQLPCEVRAVTVEGPLIRVDLDCGWGLSAYITRPAREELGIEVGTRVYAMFKSQAVHLITRKLTSRAPEQ